MARPALRVAVLDCYSRMGLAVVNGLDPGYVLIGGTGASGGIRFERYLRTKRLTDVFRYPRSTRDPAGFREAILDACERHGVDVVFPCSSATATALSRLREQGDEPAAFVVERWDRLSVLADKWQTYLLALELRIPAPMTVLPEMGIDDLSFPVVAKPRLAEASRGVRFFDTSADLERFLSHAPPVGHELGQGSGHGYVVQEVVRGGLHGVGACAQRGRPVSLHTNRRVLTRHEFGGNGLVHELTHEEDLMEWVRLILARLEWNGPVNVEFMRNEDGRAWLIEANPRVWGSTELTIAGGLNVAQQALEILALGNDVEAVSDYAVGLRARWLTPGSFAACFRSPRTPSAVRERLALLVGPRDGHPTITNLRRGNLRHIAGMALDKAQVHDGQAPAGKGSAAARTR
jgi:predicted ATP-grasp superfamily ATP-dependent carboligase